jgi:hypothetical protein
MDYIVSRFEASQDGAPYVYIAFSNSSDFKTLPECPFGPDTTTITSHEDLIKNLPKAMSNIGRTLDGGTLPSDSPTFKIGMREYEDMGIKVGDKVTIEIEKSDSCGI